MPLDDLVGVIETLQQRIREHGPTLRENETRTRMALIDPLLAALGWDVSDPAVVTPEYNVSGRWADYALLRPIGQPSATLEAKKLGESLASHRMQMLNYSNASGVEYAGLTDGNHWELYEVFQRGQLEDRRILDVSIADTPPHQCALQLLLLWRPNLGSGQPMAAREPILTTNWKPESRSAPPESRSAPIEPPAPVIVETLQPSPPQPIPSAAGWVALPEFNPPGRSKPPPAIRFPDGSMQEIQHWNDMLVAVATWLYAAGRLAVENMPVRSSSKIYIVHNQPIHPTGNQFFQYRAIADTPLVVNTHGSAVQIRKNAQTLLQHCGVNSVDVSVQVTQ